MTAAEHAAEIRRRLDAGDLASDIIRDLVRDHRARYRDRSGTYELRLTGVTRSCTGGPISLLHAWAAKAAGGAG